MRAGVTPTNSAASGELYRLVWAGAGVPVVSVIGSMGFISAGHGFSLLMGMSLGIDFPPSTGTFYTLPPGAVKQFRRGNRQEQNFR